MIGLWLFVSSTTFIKVQGTSKSVCPIIQEYRLESHRQIIKLDFSIGYYIKKEKHKIAWQVIHYTFIETICRNSHFPHEMIYLRHKYFHLISCNTCQIPSVWPLITFQFAWDDKIEITFIMLQKNEVQKVDIKTSIFVDVYFIKHTKCFCVILESIFLTFIDTFLWY